MLNLSRLDSLGPVWHTSYISACSTLGIAQLSDRRREQCALMFRRIVSDQSHVLHYLLPAKRDSQLTERLRSAKPYPSVRTRTTRFQNSFIPFLWPTSSSLILNACLCLCVIVFLLIQLMAAILITCIVVVIVVDSLCADVTHELQLFVTVIISIQCGGLASIWAAQLLFYWLASMYFQLMVNPGVCVWATLGLLSVESKPWSVAAAVERRSIQWALWHHQVCTLTQNFMLTSKTWTYEFGDDN